MNTRVAALSAMVATATAPLAMAHGPHSADNTLYHYLSNPDHVFTMFAVAAMTLLAVTWAARRGATTVRRKEP